MPGNTCSLCKSGSWDKTISMFTLPSDEYLKKEWEAACGIKLTPSSKLCAKHFAEKDFVNNNPKRARLQPDAVPSLNLSIKMKEVDKMLLFNPNNCYRKNRASLGQLVYFVNFAKKQPTMLTSKFSTVKNLWEELAKELNALDGPSRTPLKWKETMATWRCQLRCRARRGKSSGVPEFDEFALCNLYEIAHNSTSKEFDEQNSNDKNEDINELPQQQQQHEINESIEADVAIKTEADCSDVENNVSIRTPAGSCGLEVDLQEAITGFEEEIDIKPDIDNEAINEPSYAGSTTKIRTLGFPRATPSKIFVIPRATSTESRTAENAAEALSFKRKFLPETSAESVASKVIVTAQKSTTAETPPKHADTVAGLKRIIQPGTTTRTSNIPEREETPTLLDNSSQSSSECAHTVQEPKTSASECKTITLNEIYETVLASIRRRDERDEQFSNVIQELTGAVTRMADNVKRLEEVLTFCTNN